MGTAVAIAVGILQLLVLCYVAGALVRSRRTGPSFERIEEALLSKVPGYEVLGSVLEGFGDDQSSFPPALVDLHGPGAAVFAMITDENDDGTLTVFVPASPALTVGVVHVVKPNLVTRPEASVADVTGCVSRWGIGSRKVLAERASGNKAAPTGAVDAPASPG
jgi:uncharacterized membrane protein